MSAKLRPQETAVPASALTLLGTLSGELHLHAIEIAALGESLSQPGDRVVAMQAFDALGQRAMAFMHLLRGLERELAGNDGSVAQAIARIPFHDLRQRLSGSSGPSRAGPDVSIGSEDGDPGFGV